jgi:cell division protein FtsB
MSHSFARVVFVLTALFFAAFFLWPVLQILRGGFVDADGRLTFAYLRALLSDPIYLGALLNSLLLACAAYVAINVLVQVTSFYNMSPAALHSAYPLYLLALAAIAVDAVHAWRYPLRAGTERLVAEISRLRAHIADLEKRVEQLDELAHQDTLITMPNRRGFMRALERFVDRAKRYDESSAMLFVDLDGLKMINDSFGHKAGDEFTARVDFPAAVRTPALAGKSAEVKVKLVRVQEPQLPVVDEAFAASFGIRDGGLAKFREDVRANLERELKGVLMARLKASTIDKLVEAHPELEVPQGMIENEARLLARQAGAQAPDALAAYLPVARRRVSAGLLIAELARQNEIRLEPRRVSEALATIASTYEEPEKVVELYSRDPQLMSGLQNRVIEDQVVEWIAEHARCNTQQLSFNDVMRPGA